jgi:hypothetical protein
MGRKAIHGYMGAFFGTRERAAMSNRFDDFYIKKLAK